MYKLLCYFLLAIFCIILQENIDQTLLNKLYRPMHYKVGVTCVYKGHVLYTMLKLHDNLIHPFHKSAIRVKNHECLVNVPIQ